VESRNFTYAEGIAVDLFDYFDTNTVYVVCVYLEEQNIIIIWTTRRDEVIC